MSAETTSLDFHALLQRLDAQDAEIQRLQALVEPTDKGKDRVRSRRDMLKLAGAAVVGAAGAAAMRVVPAAAANGDPVTVGGSFTGTAKTQITSTASSGFTGVGSPGNEGLDGICNGSGGFGVYGASDFGYGVVGQATGSGAGSGTGVFGGSQNPSGVGVWGFGSSAADTLGGRFSGGRAPINLAPVGSPGPPTALAHSVGDIWVDSAGILWACVTAGTPGVFIPHQTGGANLTHFVKVSNKQYNLPSSDGKTWVDMDATGLGQVITPMFNAQAVISVSTDLWTANSGFNQDIGVFILSLIHI